MTRNLEEMSDEELTAYLVERQAPPDLRLLQPGESMIYFGSPWSTTGARAGPSPTTGRPGPAAPSASEEAPAPPEAPSPDEAV